MLSRALLHYLRLTHPDAPNIEPTEDVKEIDNLERERGKH